ncbi:pilin [Streptomyces violascens]
MTVCMLATLLVDPRSSWAVADVPTVINNLRNWIVGLLAGLATLFLTFGGLRYLMAGGDPGEVEAAKRALKAAAIGYGLAVLAPVLVTVLQGIVGAGT